MESLTTVTVTVPGTTIAGQTFPGYTNEGTTIAGTTISESVIPPKTMTSTRTLKPSYGYTRPVPNVVTVTITVTVPGTYIRGTTIYGTTKLGTTLTGQVIPGSTVPPKVYTTVSTSTVTEELECTTTSLPITTSQGNINTNTNAAPLVIETVTIVVTVPGKTIQGTTIPGFVTQGNTVGGTIIPGSTLPGSVYTLTTHSACSPEYITPPTTSKSSAEATNSGPGSNPEIQIVTVYVTIPGTTIAGTTVHGTVISGTTFGVQTIPGQVVEPSVLTSTSHITLDCTTPVYSTTTILPNGTGASCNPTVTTITSVETIPGITIQGTTVPGTVIEGTTVGGMTLAGTTYPASEYTRCSTYVITENTLRESVDTNTECITVTRTIPGTTVAGVTIPGTTLDGITIPGSVSPGTTIFPSAFTTTIVQSPCLVSSLRFQSNSTLPLSKSHTLHGSSLWTTWSASRSISSSKGVTIASASPTPVISASIISSRGSMEPFSTSKGPNGFSSHSFGSFSSKLLSQSSKLECSLSASSLLSARISSPVSSFGYPEPSRSYSTGLSSNTLHTSPSPVVSVPSGTTSLKLSRISEISKSDRNDSPTPSPSSITMTMSTLEGTVASSLANHVTYTSSFGDLTTPSTFQSVSFESSQVNAATIKSPTASPLHDQSTQVAVANNGSHARSEVLKKRSLLLCQDEYDACLSNSRILGGLKCKKQFIKCKCDHGVTLCCSIARVLRI